MLLVLAVMVLISGIAVANLDALATAFSERSPESVMREAIAQARYLARESKENVRVRFDEKARALSLINERGGELQAYPFQAQDGLERVSFYAILADASRSGQVSMQISKEALAALEFSPSGVSRRVEIVLTRNGQSEHLRLDPFSNALSIEP